MKKGNIRNIIVGVVFVIAVVVVVVRGESLIELIETMRSAVLLPLVAAFVSQMGKYFAQAFAYSASFKTVGEGEMTAKICFPLVFGAFFMNTVAPSLNMSGNVLFIDDARRRGISGGHATAATLLMQMSIETGFSVIMVVGFVIMFIGGTLTWVMFVVGMFVFLLIALMGGALVVSHKAPQVLSSILTPLERIANSLSVRFRKKAIKPWASRSAAALGAASGEMSKNPKYALRVFLLSVLASTFELGCFVLVGISFGVHDPIALLGGYVIAILFTMVAITPMGLGVVEAAIVVLLTNYHIDFATATATSLVFRGIVFWLPFLLGTILIRRTKSLAKADDSDNNAEPEVIEAEDLPFVELLEEEMDNIDRKYDS
jgi:uncharacterized protein (TIRG00374 family)